MWFPWFPPRSFNFTHSHKILKKPLWISRHCPSEIGACQTIPRCAEHYTCQVSRLWVENFDLTPTHVYGHVYVSCYSLNWHTFNKYVNSNQCKKRKVQNYSEHLWKSLDIHVVLSCSKILATSRIKISRLWVRKSWQVSNICAVAKDDTVLKCFKFQTTQTFVDISLFFV